jgi:hypothetical protein
VFICSGPGAGATIARNTEIGYIHAAVVGGLLLASVGIYAVIRRRWGFPVAALVLFILHPAWTVGARDGDCGYFLRDSSPVISGIVGILVCVQMVYMGWVLARWPKRGIGGDYDEGPLGAVRDGRR